MNYDFPKILIVVSSFIHSTFEHKLLLLFYYECAECDEREQECRTIRNLSKRKYVVANCSGTSWLSRICTEYTHTKMCVQSIEDWRVIRYGRTFFILKYYYVCIRVINTWNMNSKQCPQSERIRSLDCVSETNLKYFEILKISSYTRKAQSMSPHILFIIPHS